MTRRTLHRAARLAAAPLLALGLAACGDRLTNAGGPAAGPSLRLTLGASILGGPSEALAKVDQAHVTVSRAADVLLDTTMAYSPAGITLSVRLPDSDGTVAVLVELTSRGQVLFRGGGSAEVKRGASTQVPVTIKPVVAAVAAPDSVLLTAMGDTVRLRGAAVFANGDTIPEALITWAADAGGTIRVGSDGLVTALRDGLGQATASFQTFSRGTRVRVAAVVSRLTLSADTFSLFVDSTRALTALQKDRNGNVLQHAVTWSSSNANVATVSAGVVRGVGAGVATITATADPQSAKAVVTVRLIPVASMQVAPASTTLLIGRTVALKATALDASGRVLVGRPVTWTSSNPGVATVDTTGLVRAVAVGSTAVTATSEGNSAAAAIDVVQPLVATPGSQVSFATTVGGTMLPSVVAVTNAGGGTLTGLTASVSYDTAASGWLSAQLSSTTAPATLTLTPSSGSLLAGTYGATVTIASDVPGAGTGRIPVQMTIRSRQPIIGATPASLNLRMRTDTLGAPVTATINVYNAGGGTLDSLSLVVLDTGWMDAVLNSTTAPTTITVTVWGYVSAGQPPYSAPFTIVSGRPGIASKTITVTYGP